MGFFNCIFQVVLVMLVLNANAIKAEVIVRNAPGRSAAETLQLFHRALGEAEIWKREDDFKGSIPFNASVKDMMLFTFDALEVDHFNSPQSNTSVEGGVGIQVWCETCYVRGVASASLHAEGNLLNSLGDAVEKVSDQTGDAVEKIADYVGDVIEEAAEEIFDGNFDTSTWDMPVFNVSLDIDLEPLPDYILRFGFEELDVYVGLETVIASGVSYEFNIWRNGPKFSTKKLGWDIGAVTLDVGLSVDLIINVDQEVTISNGFHLNLEDGVQFQIALFSKEVSKVALHGGQFEFLPVKVKSGGVNYDAVLRVSATAGIELSSSGVVDELDVADVVPDVGAGIFVGIYANIMEYYGEISSDRDSDDCNLRMDATYQFGIGAEAGAYAFVGDDVYGALAETNTPIWGTYLGALCVETGDGFKLHADKAAPSSTGLRVRDDKSTTTTETEVTYTGTQCLSTGLTDCPLSLKTVRKFFRTETWTTTVNSGVDVNWADVTAAPIPTQSFGKLAQAITTTSGVPKYFKVEKNHDGGGGDDDDGTTRGVSNKIIIGVSVGGGVLVLTLIGGCIFWCCRRRSSKKMLSPAQSNYSYNYSNSGAPMQSIYTYTGKEGMPSTGASNW